MCIIAYYPPGKEPKNLYGEVDRMFGRNPHGAGIMYRSGNSVTWIKGLMTLKRLNQELKRLDVKSLDIAIHFRITTSGGTNQEMCHPFPITTKTERLKQKFGKYPACLMHNGVITEFEYGKMSDTANLTQSLGYISNSDLEKNRGVQRLLTASTAGSRLLIMTNRTTTMYGDWEKSSGMFYSNTDYLKHSFRVTSHSYGYDWDDDVYQDDDLGYSVKPNPGECDYCGDFLIEGEFYPDRCGNYICKDCVEYFYNYRDSNKPNEVF